MMETGYMVYWMGATTGCGSRAPYCQHFEMNEMSKALELMEVLRKAGLLYVGMVSQNPNSVGKPGVLPFDGFEADGVTPYSWSKQHRGDGPDMVEGPKTMIGGKSRG